MALIFSSSVIDLTEDWYKKYLNISKKIIYAAFDALNISKMSFKKLRISIEMWMILLRNIPLIFEHSCVSLSSLLNLASKNLPFQFKGIIFHRLFRGVSFERNCVKIFKWKWQSLLFTTTTLFFFSTLVDQHNTA